MKKYAGSLKSTFEEAEKQLTKTYFNSIFLYKN